MVSVLPLNGANLRFIARVVIMGILLNLALAPLISLAPNVGKGVGRDQVNEIVDMMKHHNRTKFTSSLVIVLVIFLAIFLSPLLTFIIGDEKSQ